MTDEPTYSTFLGSGVLPPGSQPDSLGSMRRLGQYRIVRQLGRGGMGVVYQAEDTHLNRLAALKVLRADYAADKGARARFIREAQAAAQLKHDHIVTIYQVGEENDVPFLAMEFLTGKSLEEWLRPDRRATAMESLLISKQVARGLSAAHAANLIHRDIKPANLWLEAPRGRVKILDFGLARYSGAEYPALTQDGSVLGTPAFMAPEQARGDTVDHRCDLFSLGCVMYRMLTGRLPFQGNTLYAVLTAIASEAPPPPIVIRPETPQQLSNLVMQLLAKNPDDRPPSAQAVLEELVTIEQQLKVASPGEAPGFPGFAEAASASPLHRLKRTSRPWANAALALPAAALVLTGILLWRWVGPTWLNQQQSRVADLSSDADLPSAPAGATGEPAGSAPGSELSAQPSDSQTASPELRALSEINTSLDDAYAWVSPDGLEIYFTREDRDQKQAPHTYRATRPTAEASFGEPIVVNSLRHAVLSSDGLTMIGLAGEPGSEQLYQANRLRTADDFPSPRIITALSGQRGAKSPWLSDTGLMLYFQHRANGTVASRRASRQSAWSQPGRPPAIDDRFYRGGPRTWLSFSQGGLIVFFCEGGTRDSEVYFATRAIQHQEFGPPQQVLVDGEPLIGRAPRYVAATRELFISVPSKNGGLDLWAVKNFTPQSSAMQKPKWPKRPARTHRRS
ncbi:MAG: serine/threonine-protein kinase [Planctomycetaceae bacterium]